MEDSKVAVLIEDLQIQFRTFGEGLQMLNEKMDRQFEEVNSNISNLNREMIGLKIDVADLKVDVTSLKSEMSDLKKLNTLEHHQMFQMIQELNCEVQTEIKRVK